MNYILPATKLEGLNIPGGKKIKVSAYADDLLFCDHQADVRSILRCFEEIKLATGSKINRGKTEIPQLHSNMPHNEHQVDSVKVYGVLFSLVSWAQLS